MSDPSSKPCQLAIVLLHNRPIVWDQQAQIRRFLDQHHLVARYFFSRDEDPVSVGILKLPAMGG